MATKKKPLLLSSDDWADVLSDVIRGAIEPLKRDLEAVRMAQKAIDTKAAMTFAGTWDASRVYAVGDVVVRSGGLWICRATATNVAPGHHPESWTLIVKGR